MPVSSHDIEVVLELLASTPLRLAVLTRGLDLERLHARPDADSWSANEVLAHLRACADVWGNSIQAMLTRNHPVLRYVSPRTWLRERDYPSLIFYYSFEAFTRQRTELLKVLRTLDNGGWSRGATFTGTTQGREQTVLSNAQRMAAHEVEHLQQVSEILLGPLS